MKATLQKTISILVAPFGAMIGMPQRSGQPLTVVDTDTQETLGQLVRDGLPGPLDPPATGMFARVSVTDLELPGTHAGVLVPSKMPFGKNRLLFQNGSGYVVPTTISGRFSRLRAKKVWVRVEWRDIKSPQPPEPKGAEEAPKD